jgi:transmembrane sensor
MTNGTSTPGSSPSAPQPQADWEALARYLTGESSPEEAEAVRRWLAERPRDAEVVAALDRTIGRLGVVQSSDVDVEGALARVNARRDAADVTPITAARRPAPSAVGWRVLVRAIAAVIVFAVAIGVLPRLLRNDPPGRTIATGLGQRDSVRLDDGSTIVLAPQSRLVVGASYGRDERTVQLEGEAFFDVVHDDARPFTVSAGYATIRDVGTTFTVRSRRPDSVIVSVTTGVVVLRDVRATSDSVVLQAGDVGALGTNRQVVARPGAVASEAVAFTRGELVLREAPLSQVADELRRWYGIELRIENPELAERKLSATFGDESADQAIHVIRMALGTVETERRGDTVFVRPAAGARTRP